MNFLSKYWDYILAVIVITIIITVIYNNGKKPKGYNNAVDSINADKTLDKNKVLKVGSAGAEVSALQNLANEVYEKSGQTKRLLVDGDFGEATETALISLANTRVITLNDATAIFNRYF